jgi:hypothetical protein
VKKEQGEGFKIVKIDLQIYDELFNCGSGISITRKGICTNKGRFQAHKSDPSHQSGTSRTKNI